jgi:N-acetyl-gamma-glutamyl-phosphate reductase common form
MVKAAIVGASGYVGGELLRLLLGHPKVEVTQITSDSYAGQYAHFVHPNLRGHTNLQFAPHSEVAPCDLLFLATPHGQAMGQIEAYAGLAERIVDLSADFRLRNPADYDKWYEHHHPHPEWLSKFVYGLPELHREEMAGARYASGVGCNASVTILALWPLYRRGLVRETVVEVKVGSSEGGAKPSPASHHPERSGVVRTYMPKGHRHIAEIIQELALDPQEPGLRRRAVRAPGAGQARHLPLPGGQVPQRIEPLRHRLRGRPGEPAARRHLGHRQHDEGRGRQRGAEHERDGRLAGDAGARVPGVTSGLMCET